MKGRKKGSAKTGGRGPGTPNKITSDLRECLKSFLDNNLISLQLEYNKLEPKDKLRFIIDLMPYIIPKLNNTQLDLGPDSLKLIIPVGIDAIEDIYI